jgi:hypothetical protein
MAFLFFRKFQRNVLPPFSEFLKVEAAQDDVARVPQDGIFIVTDLALTSATGATRRLYNKQVRI